VSAPRVGIIGARRVRQGLGPFVARDLVAAGAIVPGFAVTSPDSIGPALAAIEQHASVSPRGYASAEQMLDREALDAVAILSPAETHEAYLDLAAHRGLAALCEKPLVWGGHDLARRAAARVAAFRERGLLLYENCQWPFALPAFERLHPGSLAAPPRRFRMTLQPASRGHAALGDTLSHPLSLLQVLVPGDAPSIDGFSVEPAAGSGPLTIRFHYRSAGHTCAVEVLLLPDAQLPRHAAIEIDGRSATRVVAPQTYQLSFAASERIVPMDDPLTSLVADFAERLRTPDEADLISRSRHIEQRMQLLAELASAYLRQQIPQESA
jgi:predicted dehydrogenase